METTQIAITIRDQYRDYIRAQQKPEWFEELYESYALAREIEEAHFVTAN